MTMYVYFNNDGEIKSISPSNDDKFDDPINVAQFSISDVEMFLSGKKNPYNFIVETIDSENDTDKVYQISPKPTLEISQLRLIEHYVTEVGRENPNNKSIITIENFVKYKEIVISIDETVSDVLSSGTREEIKLLSKFISVPTSDLFFTRKHDPYFLIKTITFSPKELVDNISIRIKYVEDLDNISIFTNKLLSGYSYAIR